MTMVFTKAPGMLSDAPKMGSMYLLVGTLTFSGSYVTGGDDLDLVALFKRLGEGRHIRVLTTARGNTLEYDTTNKKMKMYTSSNTEVAAAAHNAALTATPVPVAIIGR